MNEKTNAFANALPVQRFNEQLVILSVMRY